MTGLGKPSPRGSLQGSSVQPVYSSPDQPFEDMLLKQRNLGQDIIPSPREPKRTESLYIPQKPSQAGAAGGGFFGKSGKLKVGRPFYFAAFCHFHNGLSVHFRREND